MIQGLHDIVINPDLYFCVVRDGFVFTHLDIGNVYDALVIRCPEDCDISSSFKTRSSRSLEEHIELINKYQLEKIYVIAQDISFLLSCPSIKYIVIDPIINEGSKFDYSPLYELDSIIYLSCHTVYRDRLTSIDYSKLKSENLKYAFLGEFGHLNIESKTSIEELTICDDKSFEDLRKFSGLQNLKKLDLRCTGLKSLEGIENLVCIEQLLLFYNRNLKDISSLKDIFKSFKSLCIQNSPKITDFSCLDKLENLVNLSLYGGNVLPNLNFLNKMKKLKYFMFSMRVANNDLSPCMQIPYVNCEKGKKEYNYRNKDLPKNKSI